jgi:hypothetical protein
VTAKPKGTAEQRLPYEAHAAQKGSEGWRVAAAAAMYGWAKGREVTEAEFDAALQAAGEIRIGYDLQR